MSGRRLPKRIVFGNLEGTVRRGQGGEEERVDRLRTERHPGVGHSGGLESDGVLEIKVWVGTVREGGRSFMAAGRK